MAAIGITIIVLLAIVTVVVFLFVIGASVLVTVAVRREERLRSLTRRAPGWTARLARMLLAVPAPRMADDLFPRPRPVEKPAWYERSTGSTMREPRSD
jgi:heme/copper-type cytochrome/quinol oxidase subunit 2